MRRASPARLVVLGVLLIGLRLGSGSTLLASPTAKVGWADSGGTGDAARIREGYLAVVRGVDLAERPARGLSSPQRRRLVSPLDTYVPDQYRRLSLECRSRRAAEAHRPRGSSVTSRPNPQDARGPGANSGLLLQRCSTHVPERPRSSLPVDSQPRSVRVSAVDNAWLAAALIMVANCRAVVAGTRRPAHATDGFRLLLRPSRRG